MKVILSIKPRFAEAILNGEKLFEYRKQIFKRDVSTVIIYESSPVCRIVGEFEIEDILVGEPDVIWHKTRAHSGIDKVFFDMYFSKKNRAYAIKVANVVRYNAPLEFESMANSSHPPQSFMYIRDELKER